MHCRILIPRIALQFHDRFYMTDMDIEPKTDYFNSNPKNPVMMGTFNSVRRTSNDPPAGAQGFTLGAYTSSADTGSCVAGESEFRGSALCWQGHTGSGHEHTWWTWGKVFGVTKVTPGEWHHYAVARSSGTIYVFLDGGLEAMKTVASGYCETDYVYPGLELAIGGTPDGARLFQGYIDEVRISKGIARWTSSFIPTGWDAVHGPGPTEVTISHTVTLADEPASGGPKTDFSWTGVAIGEPADDRQVIVAIAADRAATSTVSSSVTVGSVSATQVAKQSHTASGNGIESEASIWAAVVPSGTTADIAISFTTNQYGMAMAVFAMHGASTTAYDTGGAEAADAANGGVTLSTTLNIPAGGAAVGVPYGSSSNVDDWVWTGLTERAKTVRNGAGADGFESSQADFAADGGMAAETARAISAATTQATNNPAMCVASWAPG